MNRNYVLTESAEADLQNIIRYTRKEWGDAQARYYVSNMEKRIMALAAGEAPFRDLSEIWPSLRVARCGHHYVFCLPRDNEPALVIALFHERMDLMVRLSERLQ